MSCCRDLSVSPTLGSRYFCAFGLFSGTFGFTRYGSQIFNSLCMNLITGVINHCTGTYFTS